jgi:hypothetical protein
MIPLFRTAYSSLACAAASWTKYRNIAGPSRAVTPHSAVSMSTTYDSLSRFSSSLYVPIMTLPFRD